MNFTDTEMKTLQDALDTWGTSEQKAMAVGEIGEFLSLFGRSAQGRDTAEQWHDEIADVLIMMEQMAFMHDYDAVMLRKTQKMERLAKRLADSHEAQNAITNATLAATMTVAARDNKQNNTHEDSFPIGQPVRIVHNNTEVYGNITGHKGGQLVVTTPYGTEITVGMIWVKPLHTEHEFSEMDRHIAEAKQAAVLLSQLREQN